MAEQNVVEVRRHALLIHRERFEGGMHAVERSWLPDHVHGESSRAIHGSLFAPSTAKLNPNLLVRREPHNRSNAAPLVRLLLLDDHLATTATTTAAPAATSTSAASATSASATSAARRRGVWDCDQALFHFRRRWIAPFRRRRCRSRRAVANPANFHLVANCQLQIAGVELKVKVRHSALVHAPIPSHGDIVLAPAFLVLLVLIRLQLDELAHNRSIRVSILVVRARWLHRLLLLLCDRRESADPSVVGRRLGISLAPEILKVPNLRDGEHARVLDFVRLGNAHEPREEAPILHDGTPLAEVDVNVIECRANARAAFILAVTRHAQRGVAAEQHDDVVTLARNESEREDVAASRHVAL
mmetsp:Transcript_7087/g.18370  ORF Transcript_7087/g.18370 Transcript_7087/m.18370 type:complete len:358 (-) Transcript_7087:553-1626(-)